MIELKRLWKLKSIKVVPIVIGCVGSFTPNLYTKHLKELLGKHLLAPLVKAAIVSSTHVLRRVLGLPDFM